MRRIPCTVVMNFCTPGLPSWITLLVEGREMVLTGFAEAHHPPGANSIRLTPVAFPWNSPERLALLRGQGGLAFEALEIEAGEGGNALLHPVGYAEHKKARIARSLS